MSRAGTREIAGLVILVLIMLAGAVLAPAERTLGNGIRVVYLHVSATWAALVGIYATGLMALLLVVRPGPKLERRLDAVAHTALTFFAAGFALSLVAARINWGGVLWGEPRLIASVRVLVAGIVVMVVGRLWISPRVKAAFWLGFTAYATYTLRIAEQIFHPDRAVDETAYLPIRATFYAMFGLMLAAGVLVFRIFELRSRPKPG